MFPRHQPARRSREGAQQQRRTKPHERVQQHRNHETPCMVTDLSAPARYGSPSATTELPDRSEEHTSELQSLMRISYAVFCLKNKKKAHHRRYISKKEK